MSNPTRPLNEKLFSINSIISNYSSKIDKLINSTSGINTTFASGASNNCFSHTINKYLSQSADYLSRSATNSSITRSTNLFTVQTGLKNSTEELETDYRHLPENKLISNSEKSENLHTFSPITPIVDQSDLFSDCSGDSNSDKLIYKSIMIIDVLNKINSANSDAGRENSVLTHECQAPSVKNVFRKSFNNFYLLNQLEGDYFSYDLIEREALEPNTGLTNSLKRKKNFFKKTGKITINYTRNFRKKIRENPFVVYNQNGRKLVKKLLNKSKNPDMALSPTDLENLFATISNDYEYAFEYVTPRRKAVFNKKKKLPRKAVVKFSKLSASNKNSSDSEGSESSTEHPCSLCTENEYQNNMNNKNQVEVSGNEVDASNEFARADDDFELNGHVKSSDDEFTESYCDVLATIDEKEANEVNNHENLVQKEVNDEPKILDLIINRLPGEKLGLNLKVEDRDSVIVVSVTEKSAADRASDLNGNRQPIHVNDELLEINGVSLINMSNDDILSVVQELPLHVSLKLKRYCLQITTSPTETIQKNNEIESGQSSPNDSAAKVPIGYNLNTIYLSSLETKCIMPSDLKESTEVEGFYKMQKSTLQIGEQDNLKKGDIIYCINGETMAYCNKFDLVSKLSNLNGIAEVSVLRKSNCYGSHKDQVPYHNGIFAQNSIKLAMPKYDKPSIKSNSENDMHNTAINSSKTDIFSDEFRHSMYNIRSEVENESQVFKATLVQCKDLEAELNNAQPESIENDNWLLYDKNSTEKILKSSTIDSRKFEKTDHSITETFRDTETVNPRTNMSEPSILFDHGTARSLTSSSCHSERSMIQLNAVCIENDLISKEDESESELNIKSAKESDSFPEYSVIVPKNDPSLSDKYISTCQIEIKSLNPPQNKISNLKVVKPCRVTFESDFSDNSEAIKEKTEPIIHPKSTDLETLIEDNFPIEIKDMTENDCDLNSPRVTSNSSDYCKLTGKGLNDTDHDNYEKFDHDFENEVIKSIIDMIMEKIEFMDEENNETLSDRSSFGLKETFEEFDEATRDIHPDETSDTILDEVDLKENNNFESAFECEEPRPEVINDHKDDELKNESTLSRLLKSDSDSSTSMLKHSTQIGLDDTQACLNTSIPTAPPLPEKLFSSISDVSAIHASFDVCKTLEKAKFFKEKNLSLKESSLPNMTVKDKENIYDKVGFPIRKISKFPDRFNSLVTARPYNSLKNPITKQDKSNNYCKALISFKKQNSTFSKFFIIQTRSLFNDQIVLNRSTCSLGKAVPQKHDHKQDQILNNSNGNIAQKTPISKSEKAKKDDLIIDYVESACDKQIKQKSLNQNNLSLSNPAISSTTLSGNGPVSSSMSIKNEKFQSVDKKSSNKFENLSQTCSVKEKIMLFTQNSESISKIDKPKIYEPKLSKSILVTSTPSINESVDLKSTVSISIPKNLNNSFTVSKQNLNNSIKFLSTSTLNKNFVSQPNISFIEKRPELVESIIIKDESITSIQKDEEESLPKFKSVKDKIAYFSSKSSKSNCSNQTTIQKKNLDYPKVSSHLSNKIEIVKSNETSSFDPVSEDYDSLKNAYRLNSIANLQMGKDSLGKSCMNLKTCQKEFMREVKQRYSSTSLLNTYNSSKLELKNFIYSNENKISDLIENIEQKMKKN